MTAEEQVRIAFEPIIKTQTDKLKAMRAQFARLHHIPEEKVLFTLRAEGRINITTKFAK